MRNNKALEQELFGAIVGHYPTCTADSDGWTLCLTCGDAAEDPTSLCEDGGDGWSYRTCTEFFDKYPKGRITQEIMEHRRKYGFHVTTKRKARRKRSR